MWDKIKQILCLVLGLLIGGAVVYVLWRFGERAGVWVATLLGGGIAGSLIGIGGKQHEIDESDGNDKDAREQVGRNAEATRKANELIAELQEQIRKNEEVRSLLEEFLYRARNNDTGTSDDIDP